MPLLETKQVRGLVLVATAASVSAVAATTTSTQLVGTNAGRLRVFIENASTAILFLRVGTGTASSTGRSIAVTAGSTYSEEGYTGPIQGVWTAADGGQANVTEYT